MSFTRKLLASVLFAGAFAASSAVAQTEIKLGHVGEPGSLFDKSSQEFARIANEKLAGKAKVVVFGSSQLGGDSDMVKKLKLGTIDLSIPSTIMSSEVPAFGLFEMPYLVRDRDHMARIRDEIVLPELVPLAEKKGLKVIGVWENGFRHVTNSKRPIVKPEDLQGIKLRVPPGIWRVKMFQAYGANPSPLAFSEVFVALQTGVMDGQENPFAQIYPARFQEVQKYLSLTGHIYGPAFLTAGRSWDRFDPEVRKVLQETAVAVQPFVMKAAAELEDDLLKKLKEAGMEVNEVDKDAFIKASDTVYKAFATEVPEGKAMVEKALALGTKS
jgi:tripartite ATP-independent transporter DctP family solute receptor